ncbi:MAG: hypothetical protein UV61_C0033G0011 [Candidatus Gottesmanbacteria bacterium GW2011_GWB1_43_11]|uniref:Uncharacterized protein n=1 Tax=Candidatus Gottesmanbacteria bacterium GW2011_GWB1_43_11 TaxID=1618446 RepID=A0A0G1CEU2_9BACT|nr:MAG: hypothetical protein UV04_C0038G0012 [Candidatus Gottesmanbacteria bacterium GW2011_GWA2_42_16]KKS84285.1 MAG: hypothetical protein UV61_C0033G0011 [Candidatus Gottesmanbacteria bacterium GW2011_GWB1_43_11]
MTIFYRKSEQLQLLHRSELQQRALWVYITANMLDRFRYLPSPADIFTRGNLLRVGGISVLVLAAGLGWKLYRTQPEPIVPPAARSSSPPVGFGGGAESLPFSESTTSSIPTSVAPNVDYSGPGCVTWNHQPVLPGYVGEQTDSVCLGNYDWYIPNPGGGEPPMIVDGPTK